MSNSEQLSNTLLFKKILETIADNNLGDATGPYSDEITISGCGHTATVVVDADLYMYLKLALDKYISESI